jgi:hypothetical protein
MFIVNYLLYYTISHGKVRQKELIRVRLAAQLTDRNARRLITCLRVLCMLTFIFLCVFALLIVLGRVEVNLVLPTGTFERAPLLGRDSEASRFLYATIGGHHIRVEALHPVDWATRLGIALIGLLHMAPIAYCFYTLTRFFTNIGARQVFTSVNANLLMRCGCVLVPTALVFPLLSAYVIPPLVNLLSANQLSVGITFDFSRLFFGIVLIVAAYIFHYGLYLQEEADATL